MLLRRHKQNYQVKPLVEKPVVKPAEEEQKPVKKSRKWGDVRWH